MACVIRFDALRDLLCTTSPKASMLAQEMSSPASLRMARRSASEVQSQLYLAVDRAYITPKQREIAHNLADEVKHMINSLHKRLTDQKE
jgi:hypothetical protein